jgi:SAM-dependent methyltransferase
LPLRTGDRAIDVPCGDGFFAECLARRVGPDGRVAAVDLNPVVFWQGRAQKNPIGPRAPIRFREADAAALPFEPDSFDLAWCAHSLISLDDPQAALREMRRVVRPGGFLVIVENDVLHDVLLPWPADLDLAVGWAEREAYRRSNRTPGRLHIVRRLGEILARLQFSYVRRASYAIDRWAPLSLDDERFVALHLQRVWQRVNAHLCSSDRCRLWQLIDPQSKRFLPHRPDFAMTCLDVVTVARVPGGQHRETL